MDSEQYEQKNGVIFYLKSGAEYDLQINPEGVFQKTELMRPAYQQAMLALNGIVNRSRLWTNSQNDDLYGYANNIIAFSGGRGQGKTSAMVSFAYALRQTGPNWPQEWSNLESCTFHVLHPIDPTYLGETDSVVEIVLSQLAEQIEAAWKSSPGQDPSAGWLYSDSRKNAAAFSEKGRLELLEQMQDCLSGLHAAREGNVKGMDRFENLAQMGDIFRVKDALHKLILALFRLQNGAAASVGNQFLVIQLDDTDLQFKTAYACLEEIRKYLSLPNTVVLMSTYLEQLRNIIEQHYAEALGESVRQNTIDRDDLYRITAKYLDKLIPTQHRVHLPEIRIQYEADEEIILQEDRDGGTEYHVLEERIFQLFSQKIDIVFLKHDSHMHHIIPSTLRGLRHLYRLLVEMENYNRPEINSKDPDWIQYGNQRLKGDRVKEKNLTLFENYFLDDWCASKLNLEDCRLIQTIHEAPPDVRVRQAVYLLRSRYFDPTVEAEKADAAALYQYKDDLGVDKELNPDLDDYPMLMRMLDYLDQYKPSNRMYLFVFAVHTYFTIQFHRDLIVGWRISLRKPGKKAPPQIALTSLKKKYDLPAEKKTDPCAYSDKFEKEFFISAKMRRLEPRHLKNIFLQGLYVLEKALDTKTAARLLPFFDFSAAICCNWDLQDQISRKLQDEEGKKFKPLREYGTAYMETLMEFLRPRITKKQVSMVNKVIEFTGDTTYASLSCLSESEINLFSKVFFGKMNAADEADPDASVQYTKMIKALEACQTALAPEALTYEAVKAANNAFSAIEDLSKYRLSNIQIALQALAKELSREAAEAARKAITYSLGQVRGAQKRSQTASKKAKDKS